jgi:amino acid adenylation domain-containing protein
MDSHMEHILIHEWVARTAREHPDRLALQSKEATATFRELEEQSCIIQRALSAIGVQKGDIVALATEDRAFLVPAILGVLKQGGIFAPIHPFSPDERLQTMLQMIQPKVVVRESTQSERLRQLLSEQYGACLFMDKTALIAHGEAGQDVCSAGWDGDDCCYIFFTSGSTGQPKPIAGRMKAVDHFIRWEIEECEIAFGAKTSQLISPTFDAFVRDIFVPLCSGGTICLPPMHEGSFDANSLCAWIEEEEINVIHCVPTLLRSLLNAASKRTFQAVTHLFVSGEVLTPGDVGRWFQCCNGHQAKLINLYGPSETTMTKFAYCVKPGDQDLGTIPIGKPIRGAEAILLNQHGRPAPVGAIGEIYIRTPYRSLGYYGKPDLNKEAFIVNPFRNDPTDLLYKTGDIGRMLEDGNYEFLGRSDSQIKLRGIRIELFEIEAVIRTHPQIQDCVVAAVKAPSGENSLCAYYISSAQVNSADLRDFVGQKLPEYMRPAAYVELTKLPLLPNGKVDRSQLPLPQQWLQVRHLPPASAVEEMLCDIWAEILRLERVGVEDNFFELGGHSLMATQVISRVRHVFNCEVSLRAFLQQPTIRKLAHEVEQQTQDPTVNMATPIPVASRKEKVLPLSFAQQRLWFLAQLEGVSGTYHMPVALRLRGKLDVEALKRSLDAIWARHEGLRSVFVAVEGEPRVELLPAETGLPLLEHDLRGVGDAEEKLQEWMMVEAQAPFDLQRGPLIRAHLVRVEEQEHVLLLTQHHIVSDGWSMGILARELGSLYGAFSRGAENPLSPLRIQYPDYAAWQREWLTGERLQKQSEYWREALAEAPALLELPTDRPRPEQQSFAGGSVPVVIERELAEGLKELSRRHGVTLFMTLLSGWAAVLSRLSGQQEVLIGITTANRGWPETEGLIGLFVNTLALRVDITEEPRVEELLERVKRTALAAQQHQDVPFEQVVEMVQPPRRLSHTPVFQVMFEWRNHGGTSAELPGVKVERLRMPYEVAKFDLELRLAEEGDRIVGGLNYASALFDQETIERQRGYLLRMLEVMVADSQQRVARIEIMGPEERQLLVEWNATEVDFGVEACVHQLFEKQVEQTPDNVAVEYGSKEITYRELDRRANQLAHYLRKQGIGPEMVVGIWVERSVEMVVGILGILKAGGAYMTLDGNYPEERLEYMTQDAQISLMLVGKEQEKRMPRMWVPVVVMDGEDREWEREEERRVESGVHEGNLAYVIYTSGSTGKPKGVGVSHGGLRNYLEWNKRTYWVGNEAKSPVHTPLSFDLTVTSLYGGLLAGAGVRLVKEGEEIEGIGRVLKETEWGVVKLTPSHLRVLSQMERGSGEERKHGEKQARGVLVIGGEALSWSDLSSWQARGSGVRLINEYGPTETVVGCCVYEVGQAGGERGKGGRIKSEKGNAEQDGSEGVPIGRPIANAQMYILDGKMELVPIGVRGEIYIGGAGLARGYVNRAEVTADRFLPNPFSARCGERLYRTGDVGRYRDDGNIEYVGRMDEQVKIRGYRIELGEIEARLKEHGLVEDAVVIAREDTEGEKRLVAYVVMFKSKKEEVEHSLCESGELEAAELSTMLHAYLAKWLPEYMAPGAIVRLERIPLTPNGKLDRKALLAPAGAGYAQRTYEPPQGEMEEILANLWQELLGVERVGRHDNFFELGGHSLLAVRMLSYLLSNLNVQIELSTLFNYPQLALFAKRVLITSIEQEFDSIEFKSLVSAEDSKS